VYYISIKYYSLSLSLLLSIFYPPHPHLLSYSYPINIEAYSCLPISFYLVVTMDTSKGPTPVVFKTLTRGEFASVADKTYKFTFFTLEHHKANNGGRNDYYLLISDSDPAHPLRLYQPAMNRLQRQLDFAFKEANKLKGQHLEDNETYDCGIINSYGQMMVRLVLSTFRQHVNIWLRLYTLNEKQECLPTKTGVRFSPNDNLTDLANFISEKN
jgi:hypothetical protein